MSRPHGIPGLLLGLAAVVIVAGSAVPWLRPGLHPVGGIPGDASITLTFGALLAVGGVAIMLGRWRGTGIVAFALALGCATVAVIDITTIASTAELGAVGPGLWVTAAGAVFAIAAAEAGRRASH